MSQIYEKLLSVGKAKKTCTVCNRHLNDQEMVVFEKFVRFVLLIKVSEMLSSEIICAVKRRNEEIIA